MRKLLPLLEDVIIVVWFGSLWTAGLIAAPVLFQTLPSIDAANAAGKLFQLSHWIGTVCAAVLLVLWAPQRQRRLNAALWSMLAMMLVNQWWVMSQVALLRGSAAHAAFVFWHSLASAIYLLECLTALLILWMRRRMQRQ